MSNFPNIARYYAVIAARDNGLSLCLMLALIFLALLVNVRLRWPDDSAKFMRAFVMVYYLSLVGLFLVQFRK